MPFWSGFSGVRSGVFSAVFAGLGAGVVTLLVLKNFLKDMKLGELLRVQGNTLEALEKRGLEATEALWVEGGHSCAEDEQKEEHAATNLEGQQIIFCSDQIPVWGCRAGMLI